MKKLLVMIAAICLVATAASAGLPKGSLQSMSKFPEDKKAGEAGVAGVFDCSGAIEISLDNTYFGDNTGLPNNITTYGCSPWDESGGEVIYHIFLATPTMFEASITPAGCDLDLAVLDQCDDDIGCQIVVDSGVSTLVPITGDVYFVVDGFGGAECAFEFTITSVALPEPVSFCDDVLDVWGTTSFSGDTCGGVNAISSLGCEDFTEAGLENYFEIFMPAASTFTAEVTNTADGALWVVDACVDPIGCLAYSDNTLSGDPETISYTNTTSEDMFVFLVIDSWGTGSCGTYDMTFTATRGAIAVEHVSFGQVKSMFR